MFKFILTLALFLPILNSCSALCNEEKLLYETINRHGEKYKKKGQIYLIGTGGAIPDKIHGFQLEYQCYYNLTIDEARKMIIPMVEDLINSVNNNQKIIPYLNTFPINSENINLGLAFYDKNDKYPAPPHVAYVFTCNGKIIYYKRDNKQDRFIDKYVEKYDDALRIVREEQDGKILP